MTQPTPALAPRAQASAAPGPVASAAPRVGIAGYSSASWLHVGPIVAAGGVVSAVATRNPARRAQAEADTPGVRIVDDLEAMLQLPDLDLIVLSTPTGLHHDHALQVIAAGLPVVVEKPLGIDVAEVREVVEAADDADVPLTVFLQRRWDPSHLAARHLVETGALGDVWRLEYRWERWRPEPLHRWREDTPTAMGGGQLLDLGPHMLDLAVQLFGPVGSVYAELSSRRQVSDDDTHLVLHHVGGQVSHLDIGSLVAAPGPRLRIVGSEGTYVYDDFTDDGKVTPIYPDLADAPGSCGWLYRGPQEREPVAAVPGEWADFYRQLFDGLSGPERRADLPVAPADVLHLAEIFDAAQRSAAQGQVVAVRL
ncbi:Gfo/Idh/MocA family protein [Raineyella fluvialis]|uniref:Gfo/Idh/MocA family oxidoreductase n=1 Tax=Raineyella fluvialis TaxID=2662261 RepID=A0A5Q2F9K3_9ACTN|nr:Gfo/Idh/MocA family oxidoreductase [Raineyella fluvialis]QGF23650.1 gfo/Idh/MocA family oxidoreductase [Raineyella fluvialis]